MSFSYPKLDLNACARCLFVKMIYCENDLLTKRFSVYERFTAQSDLVSQNDLVPQTIHCQKWFNGKSDLESKKI